MGDTQQVLNYSVLPKTWRQQVPGMSTFLISVSLGLRMVPDTQYVLNKDFKISVHP